MIFPSAIGDNAPGRGGDPVVMGDENDGAALLVQLLEEAQHLVARPGVQCAGGLVRHDDGGWVAMARAMATRCCWPPDIWVGWCCARSASPTVPAPPWPCPAGPSDRPLIDQGQLHIFQHRQALDQVILLEDEADLLVADVGQLLVRQLPDVDAVQEVRPPGGDVQAAQHVHHGGLAGAGLAHHRHELAPFNIQRDAVQGPDLALQALAVDLIDVPQFDSVLRHGINPTPDRLLDLGKDLVSPSSTPDLISTLYVS